MTVDQLSALCGVLIVLLSVSEALPFMKTFKANGWGQLLIAVIKAIAAQAKSARR
jgi:hypothetical protein